MWQLSCQTKKLTRQETGKSSTLAMTLSPSCTTRVGKIITCKQSKVSSTTLVWLSSPWSTILTRLLSRRGMT
ncbi:unnamed protein product [Timema podura]|uniref:Uncharacterized protein n=1 Tax=Timema podura TaxID=61482 RepID=A0ABN7PHY9_TIMPD|nr:unnamed protein product [Timema podura]